MQTKQISTLSMILVLAFAQLINVSDFIVIQPLIPLLQQDFNVDLSYLALLPGVYTLFGAVASFLVAFFIHKLDKKKYIQIIFFVFGCLQIMTFFVNNFMAFFVLRGLLGFVTGSMGTTLTLIVIDNTPIEKRGTYLGLLMSSYSIATVVSIPFVLLMGNFLNWRLSFLIFGAFDFLIAYLLGRYLPNRKKETHSQQGHFSFIDYLKSVVHLLGLRHVQMGFAMIVIGFSGTFVIFPSLPVFLTHNLHVSQQDLILLYILAGVPSLFIQIGVGRLSDKYPPSMIAFLVNICFFLTFMSLLSDNYRLNIHILFPLFLGFLSARNVSLTVINSKIPTEKERNLYMSINGSIIQLGMTFGSVVSSFMVSENPVTHDIEGLNRLAIFTVISLILVTYLAFKNDTMKLRKRKA